MRGIMFNEELGMWDAVLSGIKTNTRRVEASFEEINKTPADWQLVLSADNLFKFYNNKYNKYVTIVPRHKPNQILYLQEPVMNVKGFVTEGDMLFYKYKDSLGQNESHAFSQVIDTATKNGASFGNKMYMNSSYARYYIQITGVKVERIQDISKEDALAEGILSKNSISTDKLFATYRKNVNVKLDPQWTKDHKASYGSLIKVISDDNCWADNYWCISYHFKLTHKPVITENQLTSIKA